MSGSILTDTKAALGLAADYTPFDTEIIMFINATLANVHQLGVGPPNGFSITDNTATWTDLIDDDDRLNQVKSYIFISVKLLYDPPTIGFVQTAYKELREEAAWRLNRAREDIVNPIPTPAQVIHEDIFGDPVSIDGGDLDA